MSVGRGVVLKGVADAAAKVGGFITLPVLIRFAGADGYGAYSQVSTIVSFLIPFAALGLTGSIVRFFATEPWTEGMRRRFVRVLSLSLVAALVPAWITIWAASWLNVSFLRWEQGGELIRWGAGLIVATTLEQVVLELLRARQRIAEYALFQLSQTCVMVLATVWLLPHGYGLVSLLAVIIIVKLAMVATILLGLWHWNRPSSPQVDSRGTGIGQMMHFGVPVALSGLGLWMMNVGDRLVVGHYLTAAALGRYSAVYTFASLLLALNAPLNLPLYPALMRAVASKEDAAVHACVRKYHRYATMALVPAAVLLVALVNPALAIVGGAGLRVSILVIGFVVVAVFLDQWNAVAQYILLCMDRVTFVRNAWMALGAVNVLANIVMVPVLGLVGAGLVSLITFIVLEAAIFVKACTFFPLLRLYRFDVALKAVVSAAIAAVGVLVILNVLPPSAPTLLAGVVGFAVGYVGMLVLLRELGVSEFRDAARLFGLRVEVGSS